MTNKPKKQPVRPIFRYAIYSILFSAIIYLVRLLWWAISIGVLRETSGLLAVCVLPAILAIIAIVFGGYILFVTFTSLQTRNILSIFVLFLSTGVMLWLPLPPSPTLPEEVHFFQHRADYEQIVELARQNRFEQGCGGGYILPQAYDPQDATGCIYLTRDELGGKIVTFSTIENYDRFFVVYIESGLPSSGQVCYPGASLTKRLDRQWFICYL